MFTKDFSFFNKLNLGEFKLLYLLGSDNLNFKKQMSLLSTKEAMGTEEPR